MHRSNVIEESKKPLPLAPSEGWMTVFAGVAMMAVIGFAVQPGLDLTIPVSLALITSGGYLIGFLLAKLRVPDLLAHLVVLLLGYGVGTAVVDRGLTWELLSARQIRVLLDYHWARLEGIVTALNTGARVDDPSARLMILLTLWLVGYASAWMLFRRNWYIWSVLLGGAILLTSLAMNRTQSTWPALAYLGLSIVQGARFVSFMRSARWTRQGLGAPRTLGPRSTLGGIALSAVVLLASLAAPLSVSDETRDRIVTGAQGLSESLLDRLDDLSGDSSSSTLSGDYGQFSDEFRVGEGVPSGDTEIALLRATRPAYLAARKFDSYDGQGWSSSFESSPSDGSSQPPRIAFSADQAMSLPDSIQDARSRRTGVITLFQPGNGLLLTIETHETASVPTAVRVGWQAVDMLYPVERIQLRDVPVDLRTLVSLLKMAEYRLTPGAESAVSIVDPSLAAAIQSEQKKLLERYPVESELYVDADMGLVLRATGRLPVYEDVEGVFYSGDASQPSTYTIAGLEPSIPAEALRSASADYPEYVLDRYLQIPESVTDRTRVLAQEIVTNANATTSYDMAMAIQTHLRSNYEYLLEANLAPDGQDIIDYFLFDSQVGRCDHYASSMAIMLRSLGVPARIVTGLAPVAYDETQPGFVYRARDAHSWVEVYFPDYGWIPFEPTPSEAPIDLSDAGSDVAPDAVPTPTPSPEPALPADQSEPTPEASPVASAPVDEPQVSSGTTDGLSRTWWIAGGIVAAISALAGFLFLLWAWPLRRLAPGASYFLRFQRLGRFWGVEPRAAMTPEEYAELYGAANPRYAGAAHAIADAYVGERYGPESYRQQAASIGGAAWRELRRAIVTWRPWRRLERGG
jgi:hypothetical protein